MKTNKDPELIKLRKRVQLLRLLAPEDNTFEKEMLREEIARLGKAFTGGVTETTEEIVNAYQKSQGVTFSDQSKLKRNI